MPLDQEITVEANGTEQIESFLEWQDKLEMKFILKVDN